MLINRQYKIRTTQICELLILHAEKLHTTRADYEQTNNATQQTMLETQTHAETSVNPNHNALKTEHNFYFCNHIHLNIGNALIIADYKSLFIIDGFLKWMKISMECSH